MRELSIPIRLVKAVLRNCARQAIDQAALLVKAGISPRVLQEDSARVSVECFNRLQIAVTLAMHDEGMGYFRRPIPLGGWSLMCHAVLSSRTMRDALKRYCRFFSMLDIGLQLSLLEGDGTATIRFSREPADWDADIFVSERAIFKCHRFSCWLIQEEIPTTRLCLSHPRPAHADEYRYAFHGAPVFYDQTHTELRFSSQYLDRSVPHDELSLRQFLKNPALILLTQQYGKTSWTLRVRQVLRRDPKQIPKMEDVAEKLCIHPQTLRRRLVQEGASFKSIVDNLHRDMALRYLGKGGMSIEEIADRVGFSETSTFIRAFKRWTGMTPYTFRKGL